jgi:hypothetical protein
MNFDDVALLDFTHGFYHRDCPKGTMFVTHQQHVSRSNTRACLLVINIKVRIASTLNFGTSSESK